MPNFLAFNFDLIFYQVDKKLTVLSEHTNLYPLDEG